jgi:hypothetical protein
MVDSWHHLRGIDAGHFDPGIPGESILAVQLGDVGLASIIHAAVRTERRVSA